MTLNNDSTLKAFVEIVGAENVRAATDDDAINGVSARAVVEPRDAEDVARVLKFANENALHVAPRGGGTKMSWGARPRAVDAIVSMRRLNRVKEHAWADMTATVEAGCPVAEFQKVLAEKGQQLALDCLFAERATVGGILATNDSGALRIRYGSLRDLLLGVEVALADGTLARAGGKVVKNVAGYDLSKLMIGAFGTLGIITSATFRLYPLAQKTRTLTFQFPNAAEANRFTLRIHDSTLTPTGVQMGIEASAKTEELDATAKETAAALVDVRFEGAAVEAQAEKLISIAGDARSVESSVNVWLAREELWRDVRSALLCKVSAPPARIAETCEALERAASKTKTSWRLVMQSIGLGATRVEADSADSFVSALDDLRAALKSFGGTFVVQSCPLEIVKRIDVWGEAGDALPLMRRLKERFDPNAILNPGRFVGGI